MRTIWGSPFRKVWHSGVQFLKKRSKRLFLKGRRSSFCPSSSHAQTIFATEEIPIKNLFSKFSSNIKTSQLIVNSFTRFASLVARGAMAGVFSDEKGGSCEGFRRGARRGEAGHEALIPEEETGEGSLSGGPRRGGALAVGG